VELKDYIGIIVKRGWIIVLATVITVAAAFVVSRVQTPVYRATIYLNVFPGRLDWGLQQTIKGVMRNFAGNITSRTTAMEVLNRLNLDLTPEELSSKLIVRPIESDMLIQIDADDYDPVIARDIAQVTAEVFVEEAKVLMQDQERRDRVEVTIRDYALPGTLHRPNWKINVLAGGVLGILIGVVVIFVLSYLEADIIRTSKELEEYTGLAVLGLIPATEVGAARRRRRATTDRPAMGGT
jgi:capsular polysaccharide biosynthesis protein